MVKEHRYLFSTFTCEIERKAEGAKTMENYLFDLYGTLIDVHTDERRAKTWKKWLKYVDSKGLKHPPYYRFREEFFAMDRRNRIRLKEKSGCQVPEIDILEVYRELFEKYGNGILDTQLLEDLSYQFRVASRDYIRLFPGAMEYLSKLEGEGKHTYILSNAQRSYTWPEIEMFGLEQVTEDQFISSDYGVMKPDPAFFEALIQKYAMDKEETLMHGDSLESDVMGARAVGIPYVHLVEENHPGKYYLGKL